MEIRSVSIAIILILMSMSMAAAYDNINEVPWSGHIDDAHLVTQDWDFSQVCYQKFKTSNITLQITKIQMPIPSNVTSDTWPQDKYIRMGISNLTTLTPNDFYNASLSTRFICYTDTYKYRDIKGKYANLTFANGNSYLEPNTEYYITWYVWADAGATGQSVSWAIGTTPGAFGEWSIHRGNTTSPVWTDAFSSYNLSHVLWGANFKAHTDSVSLWGNGTDGAVYCSINDNVTHGNFTYGFWLGGVSTDLTTWDLNVTLKENTTDPNYGYNFAPGDLIPGKFYHARTWAIKNSSFPLVHGNELHFLTYPQAPTELNITYRDANYINFTWNPGYAFEDNFRTVVWGSQYGYITNPGGTDYTDVWEVFNGTLNWCNTSAGVLPLYLTAYSWVQQEEDSVNITRWSLWGATNYSAPPSNADYNFSIYNEQDMADWNEEALDPAVLTGLNTYEFATKDHVITAMGVITSAHMESIYCNTSDILTVRLDVNGTIVERCYTITQSADLSDRNVTVFKPNAPTTNTTSENYTRGKSIPVIIRFYDATGGLFSIEDHAVGTIRKNVENTTITVHSDYVQADMQLRTHLIAGDQYYFYASSDSLEETRLGGIIIFEGAYDIQVRSTPITNETWRGYVSLTSGWIGAVNQTLWLKLVDSTQGLYYVSINLYDENNLVKTENFTNATIQKPYNLNFTYDTGKENKTVHWANILMYHTNWIDSTNYFWSAEDTSYEVDIDTLDEMLDDILGPSPAYIPGTVPEVSIPYSTLIATGIIILFFFLLPVRYAAFSVTFVGVILLFLKFIGMIDISLIVIGIIIFLGFLVWVYYHKKEEKK